MMFNAKSKETTKIPRAMPTLRTDGEPSPVQYASRSRRLSEEAALAAQHVLDLEHELQGVTAERDEQRIEREVVDRENLRLKDEVARLAAAYKNEVEHLVAAYEDRIKGLSGDRDYHRERHVAIHTKLDSICAMLVDEARQPKPEPAPPAVTESLEDELARMVAAEVPRQ